MTNAPEPQPGALGIVSRAPVGVAETTDIAVALTGMSTTVQQGRVYVMTPATGSFQMTGHAPLLTVTRKPASPKRSKAAPILPRTARLIDLVPSPRTRKLLTKLLADQQDHIAVLRGARRVNAARWQTMCTWGLLVYSILLLAVSNVASAIRGKAAR